MALTRAASKLLPGDSDPGISRSDELRPAMNRYRKNVR